MSSSTNERTIRAAKDRAASIRQSNKAFLLQTMSNPQGRMWTWNRLGESRLFLAEDSLDHATLAYNAGRRNTGLKLLAEIMEWCPDRFALMFTENTGATLIEQDQADD